MDQRRADERFAGKRVLVTGASGFIGTHLCRRLMQEGAVVHAVSRASRRAEAGAMRWWQADLRDAAATRYLCDTIEPDAIIHLASLVTGGRESQLVLPTFQDNLVTTINLLTAASASGCRRIVLVGSLEEPDAGPENPVPSSPYAAAKWAASAYGRMFHRLYGTPVTIARIFMVYGPGQQDLRKLVPYVTLSLLRGDAPQLSSGRRDVDWIFVGDVAEGLLAMIEAPGIDGDTIDLGSGVLTPISAIVRQLTDVVGVPIEPHFGAVPDRPMEQIRVANTARTYARLGWRATTPLAQGLGQTVAWYRSTSQGAAQGPR